MSSALGKVHLQKLEHPDLSLQYSRMNQRRSRQVHRFLSELQKEAKNGLPFANVKPELFILTRRDWRSVVASPYGISSSKVTKHQGKIFASVDYPQRLLHQFDTVFLEASFKPPGDLNELLDLMLGFEWAYCLLRLQKLSTNHASLNALLTAYLYLICLEKADFHSVRDRLNLWTKAELEPPKNIKASLQTARSQKAITERYRLWCFCIQFLKNTIYDFELFEALDKLKKHRSYDFTEADVLKRYLPKYTTFTEQD